MRPVQQQTLYRLIETKLGSSLATYLRSAREAKKPFHVIGYELRAKTGETVNPETIRAWVRSLEESTGEAPSVLPGHDRQKPAA